MGDLKLKPFTEHAGPVANAILTELPAKLQMR